MKRVSVRGCWGQTGPFLARLCLVPRSTARRQSQWCPQWCLAQRVMLDQCRVPVPDWGKSLSTPRCWVASPAQPFCLLSHSSEKKVFSHDCSRGGGGHMAHGSFSLRWPERRGKGEKKKLSLLTNFCFTISLHERISGGFPAQFCPTWHSRCACRNRKKKVSLRQILQLAGDSRQQDLKTELKIGCWSKKGGRRVMKLWEGEKKM